ncbi:MAG: hypothetical protein ACU0C9_14175 [Paracoccaceae bacterium]
MNRRILSTVLFIMVPGLALAEGSVEVTFVDHITAGMVEQDVFVNRGGDVFRVTTEDQADHLSDTLFSTTSGLHHDPVNMTAVGPFPMGKDLGFTLGDWLGASGTGTVTCDGGVGALSASFTNLVPNGVYTMWSWYVSLPFPEPFATYDLPFGARDGADSVFRADASGNASYDGTVGTCLQGSGSQIAEGLAIAYHSDGNTYGPIMSPAGETAHIHLFLLMPPSADMPS